MQNYFRNKLKYTSLCQKSVKQQNIKTELMLDNVVMNTGSYTHGQLTGDDIGRAAVVSRKEPQKRGEKTRPLY